MKIHRWLLPQFLAALAGILMFGGSAYASGTAGITTACGCPRGWHAEIVAHSPMHQPRRNTTPTPPFGRDYSAWIVGTERVT